MPVPFRSFSVLAFVMFVLMWLSAIAQSPGGMSAFAHDIVAVEQQLLPSLPDGPTTSQKTGEDGSVDTYIGGVVCLEGDHGRGEPELSCQVPMLMPPY
jgi:hypothetical protein